MGSDRIGLLASTTLALCAFAVNSILCRLALSSGAIDPASFTALRLGAGALVLAFVARASGTGTSSAGSASGTRAIPDWPAAIALWVYAAAFSFAYLQLGAGSGALILFGSVQATMLGAGLRAGERLSPLAWLGFGAAVAGLVALVLPGVTAPAPMPAALMALAGVAWGVYSLRGRGSKSPLRSTAANFARALPLALVLGAVTFPHLHASARGALLAIASGALTSGLGYVIWYRVLRSLDATRAATVQLAVPVIAAAGGVALLSEPITARLVLASIPVLGGIALVLAQRARRAAAGG